jgi:four helix bundle protein
MNIAQASLEECRYYCLLSRDLEYMDMKGHFEQLEEVSKLLDAYAKSILASES